MPSGELWNCANNNHKKQRAALEVSGLYFSTADFVHGSFPFRVIRVFRGTFQFLNFPPIALTD